MNQKTLFSMILTLSMSVTVMANLNLALNKPATASRSSTIDPDNKGGQPFHSVDGDYVTGWNAETHGTLSSPQWVMVDLQSVYSVGSISLWDDTDNTMVGFSNVYYLYSSLNMTQWDLLGSGTLYDTSAPHNEFSFGGKEMRYVKYEVVGGTHYAHLNELEVYEIPEPCTLLLLGFGGLLIGKR